MKTALFPGSFDPFTLGHKDVLISALKLFDKVVIAIGYNSAKKGGFLDIEQRMDIIRKSVEDLDNQKIEIVQFSGLTTDYCKKQDIKYVVRGIRTVVDFEFETMVAQANERLNPEILTIFIPASGNNTFVSSSIVKDIVLNNGDSSQFMAANVDMKDYKK